MKFLMILGVGCCLLPNGSALAIEHKIVQKDKKFDRTEITIKVGDSINFHNAETEIVHNIITYGEKNKFNLATQQAGSSSVVQFKEEGDTTIECVIHTNMVLKVHVTK